MTGTEILMTRHDVERRCSLDRSTIYRLMRKGKFPVPLRIGDKNVRWKASEIEDYLNTRPRAHGVVGV